MTKIRTEAFEKEYQGKRWWEVRVSFSGRMSYVSHQTLTGEEAATLVDRINNYERVVAERDNLKTETVPMRRRSTWLCAPAVGDRKEDSDAKS